MKSLSNTIEGALKANQGARPVILAKIERFKKTNNRRKQAIYEAKLGHVDKSINTLKKILKGDKKE